MPHVVHPVAALPPLVDEAYELMHSPTRIAIVVWLARHPGSLVSDIVAGVGGQRVNIRRNLDALEAVGVVVPDRAAGDRERMRVRYSADSVRAEELAARLAAYIMDAFDKQ